MMVPEAEADFFSNRRWPVCWSRPLGQLPLVTNHNPDIQTFRKDMKEYANGADPFGQLSLEAYQDIIMLWQAASKVGFSKATGRAIETYINTKGAKNLDIWADTPVTRTPGLAGIKGSYIALDRVRAGGKLEQLGWWPSLTACHSKATCLKRVVASFTPLLPDPLPTSTN